MMLMVLVCIASVEARTRAHEQDTDYTFLNLKDVSNKTYMRVNDADFRDWWYYNARRYNSVDSIDFSKDFWMAIEPWEYEVCSRGLSTQLAYEGNAGAGSMFSGIYADTVTVAGYKRVPERNAATDPSKLYEISWYFHPANEGKYYSIKLIGPNGASKDIQARTGASKKNGATGYVALYSSVDYNKIILSDESTPQEYTFNIIETKDSNR